MPIKGIYILPDPAGVMKFYHFISDEKVTLNGYQGRTAISKHLHLSIEPEDDMYTFHIETFDRVHKDRSLSTTEKQFAAHIARIHDEVKLLLTNTGRIREISNIDKIRQKQALIVDQLSATYLGENCRNTYSFLNRFYQNEKLLQDELVQYHQYGLLINKFYGQKDIAGGQVYKARYRNLVTHALIDINESVSDYRINNSKGEVEIRIQGSLDASYHRGQLVKLLERQHVQVENKDEPTLDEYGGRFVFNSHSGNVLHASVELRFSFGKNYYKEISYHLQEIDHTEVP